MQLLQCFVELVYITVEISYRLYSVNIFFIYIYVVVAPSIMSTLWPVVAVPWSVVVTPWSVVDMPWSVVHNIYIYKDLFNVHSRHFFIQQNSIKST